MYSNVQIKEINDIWYNFFLYTLQIWFSKLNQHYFFLSLGAHTSGIPNSKIDFKFTEDLNAIIAKYTYLEENNVVFMCVPTSVVNHTWSIREILFGI